MRERDQAAWLVFIAAYSASGIGFLGELDFAHSSSADQFLPGIFAVVIGFTFYALALVVRYGQRFAHLRAPVLGRPPTMEEFRIRERQEDALPAATVIAARAVSSRWREASRRRAAG